MASAWLCAVRRCLRALNIYYSRTAIGLFVYLISNDDEDQLKRPVQVTELRRE